MNKIDMRIQNGADNTTFMPDTTVLYQFLNKVIYHLGLDGWQFSVLVTGDAEIAELNQNWRNRKGPTDVLSFSQVQNRHETVPVCGEESMRLAGDIVVSTESVFRNALEHQQEPIRELFRVLVHGVLHLVGFEHHGNDYSTGMLKLQESVLERIYKKYPGETFQ